jgi:transcription antitermination factor NusG
MWIAYTPKGREFDAQEEAEALGLWAMVPRRVDMLRKGFNRRAEPVISAYLPNYMFFRSGNEGWHWMKGSKTVRTVMGVSPGNAALVDQFIDRVETDFAARMAQIEAAQKVMNDAEATKAQRRLALEAMQQYAPDERLEIMLGPFAGVMARFKRVAEGASMFPELVVETQLFGQAVTVRVDPIAARRAV